MSDIVKSRDPNPYDSSYFGLKNDLFLYKLDEEEQNYNKLHFSNTTEDFLKSKRSILNQIH